MGINFSRDPQLAPPLVLSGPEAFYNRLGYREGTKEILASEELPLPSHIYEFQSKTARVAKSIFSTLFFPWKIYDFLHSTLGRYMFHASASATDANEAREHIDLSTEWKFHRFSLLVNDAPIDAILVGRPSTLNNGRWMVFSLGIKGIYELQLAADLAGHSPQFRSIQKLLDATAANGVFYNYPGMGVSKGDLSVEGTKNAHEAIVRYVEDDLHARAIIDKAHSFGTGNQALVWESHQPKEGISYVLVKEKGFVDFSDVMSYCAGRIKGIVTSILGWGIHTIPSSDHVQIPEIHIMSVSHIVHPQRFTSMSEIDASGVNPALPGYNDLTIPASSSSALYYLSHPSQNGRKIIIGVPGTHAEPIEEPQVLAEAIEEALGL